MPDSVIILVDNVITHKFHVDVFVDFFEVLDLVHVVYFVYFAMLQYLLVE